MSTPPLRELWDRLDAGGPPLTEVAAAAARVRRRRRRAAAVSTAAAVVAVVAVVGLGPTAPRADTDRATDPAGALPAPPTGTRWVGTGRVVVAVPVGWTTGGTTCFEPVEDTVYVDTGAIADCGNPPRREDVDAASSLAVLDSAYAEAQIPQMEPLRQVAGREVVELPRCDRWQSGQCRHLFAVPDEGVVLAVRIAEPGDGDWKQIRDSLRILPDGLTTVPLGVRQRRGVVPVPGGGVADQLAATITAVGLEADVVVVPPGADAPAGTVVDVSPPLGSVVEEGATVTVSVADPGLS